MPSKDSLEGSAKNIAIEYSKARVTNEGAQLCSSVLFHLSQHTKTACAQSSTNSYEVNQRELDSKMF